MKLKNVKSNHRFKVKLYSDGGSGFTEFTSALRTVGASGVENSYYSIDFPLFDQSNLFVRLYVEAEDGRGFVEMCTHAFRVKPPYRWMNTQICSSVTAPDTCVGNTRAFTKGDVAYGWVTIEEISRDYRFSLVWKAGALQFDFTDRWRRVGGSVVAKDFFSVPYMPNTAGGWEYRFFVELDDGKGRRALPIAGFNVLEPYTRGAICAPRLV